MQRRDFLKLASMSAAAAATPAAMADPAPASAAPARKPNVIFVVSDQHRAGLTKREGYPLDTSPALDRLAAKGIAFDQAYCASPLCVPSRTSMLTGRWPEATHVRSNEMVQDAFYPKHVYQVAKENGYKTGLAGKNHTFLGESDLDFWRSYGLADGWMPPNAPQVYKDFEKWMRGLRANVALEPTPFPVELQYPYRIVSDAMEFIDGARDQPFMLQVGFSEPHDPEQVPAPYWNMFPPDKVPDRCAGPESLKQLGYRTQWLYGHQEEGFPTEQNWRRYKSNYLGMLRLIDDQLARLLHFLNEKHLTENTIVVYLADHGDYLMDYGLGRKGVGLPECLTRIPMVWSGPGIKPSRAGSSAFVSMVDFMPTICEALSAPIPHGVQGRSLWPILQGREYPHEEFRSIYATAGLGGLYYEAMDHVPFSTADGQRARVAQAHPGTAGYDELNKVTQSGLQKMVRMGDWKLIFDMMGYGQLYHLPSDPCELKNLFGHPSAAKEQPDQKYPSLKQRITLFRSFVILSCKLWCLSTIFTSLSHHPAPDCAPIEANDGKCRAAGNTEGDIMKFLKLAIYMVLICTEMLPVTSFLYAQSTTGSVYGAVTDPTGASIPAATVTVKNVHTGVTQSTTTNSSGEYTFTTVNPGDYVVTSTANGFKTQSQTGVAVSSNQNVHVTFALTTGEVTETVEVQASVTLVDTRESQLAETIEQARFQNLPTLDRSPYDLVQTVPGVTNYNADKQTGSRDGTKFSVNGLPSDMVSFYLDGAYNNTYKQGGGNKVPNPDALQEFRLITSNFDAEFGRSPGAVANVITRSGTDHYHGSAYDYLRNDVFNAKNYFQTSVAPLKQNQFGGTFGGPVPVVKDTFFFLAYEQLILHQPAVVNSGSIIVPTDLERAGNFASSAVKPKLPAGTNCGTAAAPVICATALDPVAQNLLKFVPHANSAGFAPQQSAAANVSSYQGLARLDYSGFKNHSIEAMYFNTQGTELSPLAGNNQIVGYSGMTNVENQANVVLADNWAVNDRTVNSVRLFYTQNKYVIGNQYQGHFLADLGSTAGEGGNIFGPPKFNVNGYFSAGPAGGGPSNISQLTFGGIDTATLTRGHHSLKVGGSYVWNKYSEDGGNTAGGTFAFTGSTTGNALADFIMGRANTLVQSSSVSHRTHQYDPALYVQDDWQVNPRLNLNLGLRWEVFAPHCCEPQTTGTFVAGQQSTVIPKAPLGIVYQGDKGVAPGLFNTSMLNFAPRVGFAYDAYGNGRTSVRGGFGIFYQTVEQFNYGTMNQLPFSLSTTVNLVPNLVAPYGAGGSPYPFVYNAANPQFATNSTTQSVTPGTSAPYVYEYNLTVEQQLNPTFAFRLGYVGNATRNNVFMVDANSPVYIPNAAVSTAALNCRRPYEPYRTGGIISSATCAYTGYTTGKGYTFGAINQRTPALNANFNSLQASLRGRIGSKLNLLVSYVWAKSLNYGGPTVDNTDFRKNYGLADEDIRNRFVVSYLYRLPDVKLWGQFGRQVLSGWQVNGITALQSGNPFTVTSGVDTNRDGSNNDRVNIIADPYTHAKTRGEKIKAFINPASFSTPGFATAADNPYGNEQRNQLIGPGNINTNLSLFKEFPIFREARFQFRAESFNIFGNVNLNNPRTNFSVFPGTPTQITGSADPRRLQFAAKLLF